MGAQDIIAIGAAVAALIWIVRMFTRTFNGESGCGCAGNKNASGESTCSSKPRTGLRRRPFVPLERVGRPDMNGSTDSDAD